jgi:hypothetical protein
MGELALASARMDTQLRGYHDSAKRLALSCIDQCFIADDMLEQLPAASQVGKTVVGGIDLNKTRMRAVVEAVVALSASPNGFTASDIAARVQQRCPSYGPRHAAYDLKKLRGKDMLRNRAILACSITVDPAVGVTDLKQRLCRPSDGILSWQYDLRLELEPW